MSAETQRQFIDTNILVYAQDRSAGRKQGQAQALLQQLWQVDDIRYAIRLQNRFRISFWDAMIVASAQQLDCITLWSEDLNPGQIFDQLQVRNPFA